MTITTKVAKTKDEWSIEEEKEKFKTRCLAFHNTIRVLHGAPFLVWEETLGESAQAWANYLSTIQVSKRATGGICGLCATACLQVKPRFHIYATEM